MTIRFISRWLLVPLLMLSLQISRAQAPSGILIYDFDSDTPIWDLTGTYGVDTVVTDNNGNQVDLSFSFSMNHDERGKLVGGGVTGVFIGEDDVVAGTYRVSGKVQTIGGQHFATIVITIVGEGTVAGRETSYRLTIVTEKALIDLEDDAIVGTSRVMGKFSNLDTINGVADFEATLMGDMDGSWSLVLNILPFSNLTGTGTIVLSNGRTMVMDLTGEHSFGSDLRLKGFGDSRGTKMRVFLYESQDVQEIFGTAFGQKVDAFFPGKF